MRDEERTRIIVFEGHFTCKHLIDHNAQGINIRPAIHIGRFLNLFRRHVIKRAEQAEARVGELEKARDFHIASVDHHVEKARGEVSALEEEVERLRNTINNHKLIPREQPEEKSYF